VSIEPRLLKLTATGLHALVWNLPTPMRAIASAPLGGGIGTRRWVVNAQVPSDYSRTDPESHLRDIASEVPCDGDGVGLLTAAAVSRFTRHEDGQVVAFATVGIRFPTFAAAPEAESSPAPVGTINLAAFVPVPLGDAALVNAVITATEAKTQALLELGVAGTGTASDAICVLTPTDGAERRFAGPRSEVGSALARAVHGAVADGARRWNASRERSR
jgi:adenosylcobinamide amidohydrolase